MGIPSAANPGGPVKIARDRSHVAGKAGVTKATMHLPEPPTQGMKFVNVYIRNNDQSLLKVKKRSDIPFTIIDSVLTRYGLPQELKYLAVIESELKSTAVSRVGAKGPWQLMPGTAHVLGLQVNHKADERKDYCKSTVAAAHYLRDLHKMFGDWLLVLAAYNGGPRPVIHAIQKSHSRNFWVLQKYLPAESRLHVKKFIATAYYFEGPGKTEPSDYDQPSVVVRTVAVRQAAPLDETADEKFNRIMKESAHALKDSKELLEN